MFFLPVDPDEPEAGADVAEAFRIDMPGVLGIQKGQPAIGIRNLLGNLPVNRLREMLGQLHHRGDPVIEAVQQEQQPAGKDQSHPQAQQQGPGESRLDGDRRGGLFQDVHVKLTDVLADVHILNGAQQGIIQLLLPVPLGLEFLELGHLSPHLEGLGLRFGHNFLQVRNLQLNGLPFFMHRLLALLPDNLQLAFVPGDVVLQGEDLRVLWPQVFRKLLQPCLGPLQLPLGLDVFGLRTFNQGGRARPILGRRRLRPLRLALQGLIDVHQVQELGFLAEFRQLLVEVHQIRADIVALFLQEDDVIFLFELEDFLVEIRNGLLQLG